MRQPLTHTTRDGLDTMAGRPGSGLGMVPRARQATERHYRDCFSLKWLYCRAMANIGKHWYTFG